MTNLIVLPLVASLLLGGGTALAQEKPANPLNQIKNTVEKIVKPQNARGEKPKETRQERCLRKSSGDVEKCRKRTKMERCVKKLGSEEKCKELKKEIKERIKEQRQWREKN